MDTSGPTPRSPLRRDVAALVGMLTTLESLLSLEAGDQLPDWAARLARRLTRDGLLDRPEDPRELRQCLNDMNHRLRYALGEYDDPPVPEPVP